MPRNLFERVMRTTASILFVIVAAGCGLPAGRAPSPVDAFDVVITNGRIIDGTGAGWFYGDLGIRGDRIARIAPRGMLSNARADQRIDANGMVVSPGFIDIQSHSRGAFLSRDSRVVSKVTQGITTEIMGEGWTDAPSNAKTVAADGSVDPEAAASAAQRFAGPRGFDRWLRAMEDRGVSPNIGSFLGATTVRQYAKGMSEGAATPAELDSMRAVVRHAMEDGAFGIATALVYPPASFASTEELIELAKAMAPYGGVYISHMRSEADQFLEAIDEVLRIGREGGVPAEIYHLKAAGRRNWSKAAQAIAKIDSARAAGQDVQANMYPYVVGGTGLAACLPPWVSADGKLLDNVRDTTIRARIRAEVSDERPQTTWEPFCQLATPAGVMLVGFRVDSLKKFEGKTLGDVAAAWSVPWVDALFALTLAEEGRLSALYTMMSEENVELQLRQPWIKFGTDAGGQDPDSARSLTHPRAYGTFPRILGYYVRERKVMPLEEAIRKASSAVATRLSIAGRGVLKEGMFADVVVFDPNTVRDVATFQQPHQISQGIRHVFVNGVAVVRDGTHTGAKPGRIVRGPGWRTTR